MNNNELEELGMIDLNQINILVTISEISSNPPKIVKGLTQRALLTKGRTLIYKTKEMKSLLWCLYINTVDNTSCTSSSTDKSNVNNNELEELEMIELKPINIFMTTSEISINPPKIIKGLTKWALVTLGIILIYTTKEMNIIMWCLYINHFRA